MARREPVGYIRQPSNSGSGDAEVPEFIQCLDVREPQVHEVWDFGDNGVARQVHPKARVDVGAGVVGELLSDYLTESGRRISILGRVFIHVSVKWLGVPDFHRTGGPFWTANLLAPRSSWGYGGTTTNQNWVSQPGRTFSSDAIPWNRHVRVLLVYVRRISENTRAASVTITFEAIS